LVGKPGSGKTYMLNRLALDLCRHWTAGSAAAKVPVVIKLNSFNGMDGEQPLPFSQYVRAEAFELAPYLRQLIRDGRVILLCDALNEMPTQSADGRDLLKEVNDTLKDTPYFVVSCRIEDYRDHLIPLHPLEQVTLRDLELPAIREFFERYLGAKAADLWGKIGGSPLLDEFWQAVNAPERNDGERFWNLDAGVPSYTSGESDAAWRTMHSGVRLIPLCRNPFMGKLVSELYKATGQIPANRSRLFAGFADSLLQREQTNAARRKLPFPVLDHIHATLTDFARALQAGKVTTLPDAELPTPLDPAHLKAASQANIVLHEGGRWRFSHQLLQEYYAARVLLAAVEEQADPTATLTALGWDANEWWEAGVWRETLVLLGEMPGGPNAVAEWLAPASPELALQVVLRNADNAPLSASAKQALIDGANAHTAEPDPRGRAAAYRVLGHPAIDADHRPGIGVIRVSTVGATHGSPLPSGEAVLLPDFDWVTIPAGKFIYQQEKEPRTLPAFKISRYPVTYHQFQAFIDDPDGFYNPEWWEGLADDQYRRENQSAPGDQAFKYWNHPRERVSWYDAVAFCRWLSWRQGEEYALDKVAEWAVRLPTEFEWERVARFTDGREYPWGNGYTSGYANIDETYRDAGSHYLQMTSAVGIYPQGA
ncbi:MAG: NACHT domain-containing protein, partial [Phototrophicaceae bacterium]